MYVGADNWNYFTNIVEDAENPDAIATPTISSQSLFYNLTGRKVSKAQKGIYIQSGKKLFVK